MYSRNAVWTRAWSAVAGPEDRRHGDEHEKTPEGRDLALVMLPGMGREQRKERDGQEDARERQRPDGAQGCPIEFSRKGRLRQQGQGGGEHRLGGAKHVVFPPPVQPVSVFSDVERFTGWAAGPQRPECETWHNRLGTRDSA